MSSYRSGYSSSQLESSVRESDIFFDYKNIDSFSKRYLETYFRTIDPDEEAIAKFLVKEYKKIKLGSAMLDIGCGPTIHHILPVVPYVSRIDIADYLDESLLQIQLWMEKNQHAHKWDHFTKKILEFENCKNINQEEIEKRENNLARLIKKFMRCDVLRIHPIALRKKYPVVGFFYCAEEITTKKIVWKQIMRNVCSLVSPGGRLFLTALRATNFYVIIKNNGLHEKLPTVFITESDVRNILEELDFDLEKTVIEVEHTPTQKHHGINGVILVSAKKKY